MYVKIVNGVPVEKDRNDLEKDWPNVSFPKDLDEATLSEFGYHTLHIGIKPQAEVIERGPIQAIDGKWTRTYIGRERTAEEKRLNMRCTPRQARLALLQTGKLGQVKQAMALASESDQIEWEYGNEFLRTHGPLVSLAAGLGLTEEEVDTLFELAVTL